MKQVFEILKGKVAIFLINRYIIYGIAFIKAVSLAAVLGPYYYGIWAFIKLVTQYLNYTQLGVHNALNVLLSSDEKEDKDKATVTASSAFFVTGTIVLVLLTLAIGIKAANFQIAPKYSFEKYILLVATMAALHHIYYLFINIYRSYGYLFKIAFSEFLLQVALLPLIFIYKETRLLEALLWANILVYIFTIALFIFNSPVKIRLQVDWSRIATIVKRGMHLLIYNTSYYLIMVSSRTVISLDYEVEEMGYYSFANSFAHVAFMGLSSIVWILFPKMLYKLRSGISNDKSKAVLEQTRSLYVMANYFCIFLVITIFPFLIQFLKQYERATTPFVFLMLSQGILAYCFGYSELAIARKKEMKLSIYGFITVIINVCIALVFSRILKLPFYYIALGTLLSVIYYATMVNRLGNRIIDDRIGLFKILKSMFPLGFVVPFVLFLGGNLSGYYIYFNIAGLAVFLLLNYNALINGLNKGKIIFTKPDVI